jgi:AcrR family transcriptional regulator
MNQGRSQAERRAYTQSAVLQSAMELFGSQGYHSTSLEDIGHHCGLTIRPIYHYFGNKLKLFEAVTEAMEAKILATFTDVKESRKSNPVLASLDGFLDLCCQPDFRQIVLLDSPNILGRKRWLDSQVSQQAKQHLIKSAEQSADGWPIEKVELISRVVMASFAEIGLYIAEADDLENARKHADELIVSLLKPLARNPEQ